MQAHEEQHQLRRLFDLHEAHTTSMAPAVHIQPTAHYADSAHYQRERAALFQDRPLIVGLSCDLPGPNTYFTLRLGELPVLVTRAEDGVVRAFLNACRHRGAPVASGRGVLADKCRCPYHAWSYDALGALGVRPGGPQAFDGLPASCKGLLELPVQEACGLILVRPRVGGAPVDVAAELHELAPEMKGHAFDGMSWFGEHHSSWTMNWKQPYESFLETYHIFSLHRDTLAKEVMSTPMLTDTMGPHGRGVLMGRNAPEVLKRPQDEWCFAGHANLVYWLFPNTVLSMPMTGHAELWQFYPDAPDRTRVHVRFYAPQVLQTDRERSFWTNMMNFTMDVVTQEDFAQQEAIYTTLKTGQLPELHFGRNEPALIHYHRSLARALADHG